MTDRIGWDVAKLSAKHLANCNVQKPEKTSSSTNACSLFTRLLCWSLYALSEFILLQLSWKWQMSLCELTLDIVALCLRTNPKEIRRHHFIFRCWYLKTKRPEKYVALTQPPRTVTACPGPYRNFFTFTLEGEHFKTRHSHKYIYCGREAVEPSCSTSKEGNMQAIIEDVSLKK